MDLQIRKITSKSIDVNKVDELNNEAFPKEERIPIKEVLKYADKGDMDCLVFYDGSLFVGFAIVMNAQSFVYMSFFAIHGNLRGKGYGSAVLNLLKKYYDNKQLVLDIEPVEENAENFRQRERRKSFYLRNGLLSSGFYWSYSGMTFELLCSSLPFDERKFILLMEPFKSSRFEPIIFKAQR